MVRSLQLVEVRPYAEEEEECIMRRSLAGSQSPRRVASIAMFSRIDIR